MRKKPNRREVNEMTPIRVVGRKQKLLSFLKSEEGNADRSKVLAMGAVLGGSVLAQMLLSPKASAWDGCNALYECDLAGSGRNACHARGGGIPGINCELSCPNGWGPGKIGTCYDADPNPP